MRTSKRCGANAGQSSCSDHIAGCDADGMGHQYGSPSGDVHRGQRDDGLHSRGERGADRRG